VEITGNGTPSLFHYTHHHHHLLLHHHRSASWSLAVVSRLLQRLAKEMDEHPKNEDLLVIKKDLHVRGDGACMISPLRYHTEQFSSSSSYCYYYYFYYYYYYYYYYYSSSSSDKASETVEGVGHLHDQRQVAADEGE